MHNPAGPPPRRRSRLRTIAFCLFAVGALFVVIGIATATSAPQVGGSAGVEIRYEVTGEGVDTASITYVVDENMSMQQANGAVLPWSQAWNLDESVYTVAPLQLSAQAMSDGSGTITCRILKDGELVAERTSSGPYAIASCSGGHH